MHFADVPPANESDENEEEENGEDEHDESEKTVSQSVDESSAAAEKDDPNSSSEQPPDCNHPGKPLKLKLHLLLVGKQVMTVFDSNNIDIKEREPLHSILTKCFFFF